MAISTSDRKAATANAVDRSKRTSAAIIAGMERAAKSGLTKPYDVTICIQVELDNAGLKVVNKPSVDGLRSYGS
jgi:D-arabinose 5-phosphate isomerase GutQ